MEEEAEVDVGEFEDEDLFDDAGTAAAAALSAEEAAAREKARRELAEKFHVKLERQFVLRLPPDAAHALRQRIREAKPRHHRRTQQQQQQQQQQTPPALRMRFASDREGVLRVAGVDADFRVSVADLPCVVEAYKTADGGATLYKAGDIAQMLVARRSSDDDASSSSQQQQPYDERYRLASGLTPPTKNVRRSFRKPRDREEVQQIESDLLRAVGMAPNAEQAELEEVEEYEGEELDQQRAEDALQVPESELAGLQQQQQQQQQQSPTPQQQQPTVPAAMSALSAPAAKRPRLPSGAAQLRGVVAPVLPSDEFAPVPLPLPPPPALHRVIVAPQSPQQQIQLEARRRELLLALNQWRDKAQALLVQMNTASMEERPAVQAQAEEALRQVQEKHAELDMIRPVQSRSTSPAPFAPSAPPPPSALP